MTTVYRYKCEPATPADRDLLREQLALGADYRRELALIENRARVLLRASKDLAPGLRGMIRRNQNVAIRAARATFADKGLAWGCYQNVEEAADQSFGTTAFPKEVNTFAARDTGCVAVHLQPARQLKEEGDRWVRVGTELVRHGSEIDKSGRARPSKHTAIDLRIGTTEGNPRWVRVHARMYRPIPPAAVISWVRVKCRRVATKHRWEVHFTVNESAAPKPVASEEGYAGVDIGWRRRDDGVRIAYWWGSDGQHGELVIHDSTLRRSGKSDSLRAIRDRNRDAVKAELVAYRRAVLELEGLGAHAKPWLEATHHMHTWLRVGHFAKLFRFWKEHRFVGDEHMFVQVAQWLKQDRHLWEWEANNREKRVRFIHEAIRSFAIGLVRRYARVGVEEPFVHRLVAKDKNDLPEDEVQRRIAAAKVSDVAPSRVRADIEIWGKKYGATVVRVPTAYTTRDCSHCGWRRDGDPDPSELALRCPACGVSEDQDLTAAKNLAAAAREWQPTSSGSKVKRRRGTRKKPQPISAGESTSPDQSSPSPRA